MKIELRRKEQTANATFGTLYIDGKQQCKILEDIKRDKKIYGETRIPAGRYKIELLKEGRHHEDYKKKFPGHKGMLHLLNVPNYTGILIHIGNYPKDTLGCLLTGTGEDHAKEMVAGSKDAYIKIYPLIAQNILGGEETFIEIIDENGA